MPPRSVRKPRKEDQRTDRRIKKNEDTTTVYARIPGHGSIPILVDPEFIPILINFNWTVLLSKNLIKVDENEKPLDNQGISLVAQITKNNKKKCVSLSHVILFGKDVIDDLEGQYVKPPFYVLKKNGIWWDYRKENLEIAKRGSHLKSRHSSIIAVEHLTSEVQRLTQELNELKALKSA